MARPISLTCSKCNQDALHLLQGGHWVSNCCKAQWSSKTAARTRLGFAALNQECRSRGGLHARLTVPKKRRDAV